MQLCILSGGLLRASPGPGAGQDREGTVNIQHDCIYVRESCTTLLHDGGPAWCWLTKGYNDRRGTLSCSAEKARGTAHSAPLLAQARDRALMNPSATLKTKPQASRVVSVSAGTSAAAGNALASKTA